MNFMKKKEICRVKDGGYRGIYPQLIRALELPTYLIYTLAPNSYTQFTYLIHILNLYA